MYRARQFAPTGLASAGHPRLAERDEELNPRSSRGRLVYLTSHRNMRRLHHEAASYGRRDKPLQLTQVGHRRGLVPATESVVSVNADPGFRDAWAYGLADGMLDRDTREPSTSIG
jgi:hypothetical protein